ncbi:MAG: ATPase, partial [Bdellovibrionales bacterium RIFOXYD1_FULL_44_7]
MKTGVFWKRAIAEAIRSDLNRKIVLMSGPRQSGKTTLAKHLFGNFDYLNYDVAEQQLAFKEKSWDRKKNLIIFDELHKLKNWKTWLKGIFDAEGLRPRILVTGSSRLDIVRKAGESLAGRYFQYRLYPFDLKELNKTLKPADALKRLLRVGGFPEPFIDGSDRFYGRWRKSHLDIILRQDLPDLEATRNIRSIETLVAMLQTRVSSTLSYASLARDLSCDPKTAKQWLGLLENLFVVFPLFPYHRNIARAILKEPKYYFFDQARVTGNLGAQIENIVAFSIKKELDRLSDVEGISSEFHFLRTKEGHEIDFLVRTEKRADWLIEVKTSDGSPSPSFRHFS